MTINKYILVFLAFLAAFQVNSQKQANYWYFGEYAGLNFSMGVPVALTDGALNTGEGCSSISSAAGNLQFYTDGRFVYDRNHDQMPHGSGLLGHSSSTQSGIIVPKPASTTQFYIFTVDAYDNNLFNGLCYSRVDMTLNNGFGDVVTTEKNVSLLPLACEKVTAVGHDDGVSVWVITHQWGSDAFYAYKVTTAGVNTTPVISNTGQPLIGDMQASKGYIKVSPDGSKIAMANNTAFEVGIFNFNNSTGVVSHIVTDEDYVNPGGNDPGGPYGVEFSPNSHLLYIGEWKANRRISQYDVSSGDAQTILNSKTIVATVGQNANPIGALQLGPDNRMYIARRDNTSLSRINSPNTPGMACGFEDNAVNLSGRQCTYGLPPFIQSFFYLSIDYYWDIPTCDGTPVQFHTSASDTPDSVLWNFGDPGSGADNASKELNPTHLYPGVGNYWVTLIVYLYGVAKNCFHIIVVSDPPEVSIGNDTTMCAYDPFYLDAGPGYDGYLWQNGDTNQSILAQTTGLYWCQVTGDGGCTDTDTVNLVIHPVPDVDAGPPQTIPNGTSTTLEGSLTGGSGSFTYHWEPAGLIVNPNELWPTTYNMSGTTQFTLTVTDLEGGCTDSDQVVITVLGGALTSIPTADPPAICVGGQSHLFANPSGGSGEYIFNWTSTPGNFTSMLENPFVNPTEPTTYHLSLYDGYSTVEEDLVLPVNPLPLPDAGSDQVIPFGTSTILYGSAGSGSGTYVYHWEPANKLLNANVQYPTTVLLDSTTVYSLTVTDAQTGCVSLEPDNVEIAITGNALAVNPIALPDTICSGISTQLFAQPTGGAGNIFYNFTWSSQPPGYTPDEKDPIVQPLVTTVYHVVLDDGYKQVSGSVTVVVNPSPVVDLGPDHTYCVFDTITLDAGNPGADYIWSDGSTDRRIKVATTGIGFDIKNISVTVTSQEGCIRADQKIIVFDFAACNAIEEPGHESGFQIYPNPGSGILQINNNSGINNCQLTISDIYGRKLYDGKEIVFTDQNRTIDLNLASFPAGIYLVRITDKGRLLASMKYLLKP